MFSKLFLLLSACLACATAASVPAAVDLREAFETDEAFYIPISQEEADLLRLPRGVPRLDLPTAARRQSTLAFIPLDEEIAEPLHPSSQNLHYLGSRVRRNVGNEFETADAVYVPVSDEEAEILRLPADLNGLESDDLRMEIVTDDEIQRINPQALVRSDLSRSKRQLKIQGGGSTRQGFDISAQGRAKLWESSNQRNTVHGTAQYSQHLGGPYGNSRPNVGAGLSFTHRF